MHVLATSTAQRHRHGTTNLCEIDRNHTAPGFELRLDLSEILNAVGKVVVEIDQQTHVHRRLRTRWFGAVDKALGRTW